MATRRSNPLELLGERLRELRNWLTAALEIYELRDADTVSKAKKEFVRWACEGWDGSSGDVDGALVFALEGVVECGSRWVDDARNFQADFQLSAEPAWELAEFYLLVAFTLADRALAAFTEGTKGQMALVAMLYADAVEAREHWHKIRGPGQARNQETRLGVLLRDVDGELKNRELAIERKATARKGAMKKLANDPVHAAKTEAVKLWKDWQGGMALHKSGAAFDRAVIEKFPVITTTKTVERWRSEWAKQAKEK